MLYFSLSNSQGASTDDGRDVPVTGGLYARYTSTAAFTR